MIASVAMEAGLKTGLYTSPHLVHFNERIRVNGREISDEAIVEYTNQLRPKIEEFDATFFEATTAIAFRHFAEEKAEFGVIETGLGGRLDATNVLKPLLSIITNVGLDHTQHLGDTVQQIAWEKGGVIKAGVDCLTGSENQEALEVLKQIAQEKKVKLFCVTDLCDSRVVGKKRDGIVLDVSTQEESYPDLYVGLAGEHQAKNAQIAVLAAEYLKNQKQLPLTRTSIVQGLRNVQRNTCLHGRLEVFSAQPMVVLDVAHNPDGIRALTDALQAYDYGRLILVFGVLSDKDYVEMIEILAAVADEVIAVQPEIDRALESEKICSRFQDKGKRSFDSKRVDEGVAKALSLAAVEDMVLITGSHYVVGEAISYLRKRKKPQKDLTS